MGKPMMLWVNFKQRLGVAQDYGSHRVLGCRDPSSKYTAIINKLNTEYIS
jgi:hypothetical protein